MAPLSASTSKKSISRPLTPSSIASRTGAVLEPSTRHSIETLAAERRYYSLLFSHEFAQSFWKAGQRITFVVPKQTFQRTKPDGTVGTVTRKAYTRRSGREDAWKYHLRELAMAEEPLRYMRRYLRVEEEIDEEMEEDEAG